MQTEGDRKTNNKHKPETTQCLSTNEKGNTMLCILSMKPNLAPKRKEVLIHATSWIRLQNITLSGKSQSQKLHVAWSCVYEWSRKGSSIDRKQISSLRRLECEAVMGGMEHYPTSNGHKIACLLGSWKCSKIRWLWWLHNSVSILKSAELCTLSGCILSWVKYISIKLF